MTPRNARPTEPGRIGDVEPGSTGGWQSGYRLHRDGTARLDTGTTIVGLVATDGVVLAADRRMSIDGRFTVGKDVRKVEPVHGTAAMAVAGSVGPAQSAVRSLRAEASLYESRRGEPMSMEALSRAASHLVRGLPVAPLLGGVDDDGGHLYELDGAGSVVADACAASGSGMQVAYGVLEGRFEAGLPLPRARKVAIAAIGAASERDGASGNGATVATVTADGVSMAESPVAGASPDDGVDDGEEAI